ncbi:AraC family transcriptional regulator N-terminal domain-containing protein [Pseudomonas beijingensis]|nr:AraC family transcriptional regulator N-terminal domain-containing protein [Pseudomonas sp. FP2262]WLH48414.1 AraC family transcriptional regulator N-terminal domain-containing protein [Pseudomonas sp. FP2262]
MHNLDSRLTFYRVAERDTPTYCIYESCVAIILQGAKGIAFGEQAVAAALKSSVC